ncbi:sugar MFS transporter [Candidatus Liberibacter americanus]|nr:sugar MFS transporter [Candidatus Liberibacter americanus]
MFFLFGGVTSLNSILIPKLQSIFSLSYLQAMLVETVFFACYFLFSIPAGILMQKYGYMRSTCIGLMIMSFGCILLTATVHITIFTMFLIPICILAIGVVIIQVISNPLISLLGSSDTAASRITLAQTFNSLGTTIFPYIGSSFILKDFSNTSISSISKEEIITYHYNEASSISHIYLIIGIICLIVALLCWKKADYFYHEIKKPIKFFENIEILRNRRFAFGTLSIFLYVGAEVSIGSIMVNYLMRSDTLDLNELSAGHYTAIYWGSAMIGRFIGYQLLSNYSTEKVLSIFSATAVCLSIISSHTTGWISGYSLISIGFFNSVMFPTIFYLASAGLKNKTPEGSGIICTAISGGVIVPLIFGYIADIKTLREALWIPAICYICISIYGILCFYSVNNFKNEKL